jgi:hypothetical protein
MSRTLAFLVWSDQLFSFLRVVPLRHRLRRKYCRAEIN